MFKTLFIVPIIMICALVGTVGMIKSIEKNELYKTRENKNNKDNIKEYNLYEDDEKIAFERGVYKYVYYYSGDKIIGLERFFYYGNSDIASRAAKYLKNAYTGTNNSSVSQRGEYVVVKYNAEEYGGKTVQKIKEQYKNLQYND